MALFNEKTGKIYVNNFIQITKHYFIHLFLLKHFTLLHINETKSN